MIERDWHNCYADSWQGEIVDEAFSHPAKFSRGLIRRIYQHVLEQGWVKPGDTVLDPFAGVGLGALDATRFGLDWVGVELEQKFVDLGRENIALWEFRGRGQRYNDNLPTPGKAVLIQGDSRHLYSVIAGAVVSSPPYAHPAKGISAEEMNKKMRHINEARLERGDIKGGIGRSGRLGASILAPDGYSDNPSNLGNLPAGDFQGVIGSPPYIKTAVAKNSDGVNLQKQWETYRASGGGQSFEAFCETQRKHSQGYGSAPDNLANLPEGDLDAVVGSPPYSESLASDDPDKRGGLYRDPKRRTDKTLTAEYGESEGQLGTMPAGEFDAALGSPPYEKSATFGKVNVYKSKYERTHYPSVQNLHDAMQGGYNKDNPNNLGNSTGDTFWSASREIMTQVHSVLRPGAVAIWVLKAFVRNKAIVDFPTQWKQLGESCGFETIEIIRAWLVEERGTQYDLFGGSEEKRIERKSFFRRLTESKGSPRIDYEIVLIQKKAL